MATVIKLSDILIRITDILQIKKATEEKSKMKMDGNVYLLEAVTTKPLSEVFV